MPVPISRNAVAQALFAFVDTTIGNVVGLVTSSRKLVSAEDITPQQCPALFMEQTQEPVEVSGVAMPAKHTMHFALWLVVGNAQEGSVLPIEQLNDMVDAIETALALDPTTNRRPLMSPDGLTMVAYSARIDGTITYVQGVGTDSKSLAVIPVLVVRP